MYSRTHLLFKYLNYYFAASNGKGHGIHSPFVFEFVTKVLNDNTHFPAYEKVESLRRRLLKDETMLNIEDPGAGSALSKSSERTVSSIARNAAKSKKLGQLLFRMVKFYGHGTILEMGTSLGITTSYLSLASPGARVITIEGSTPIATVARRNFWDLELRNIELVEGNFDDTLSSVLDALPSVGFVFIDGNHRKEPTERYFRQMLPKVSFDSVLVFDDIHWSREMELAWKTIKDHPQVSCSIDLFFVGIVFFRQEFKEKQHFTIRFGK